MDDATAAVVILLAGMVFWGWVLWLDYKKGGGS